MNNKFSPLNFFDLTNVYFADFLSSFSDTWEALSNIERYIKEQFSSGKFKSNYRGSDNIFIGEGSVVADGAFINGPAIIGKNCMIGHGAFLRENCLIGDGSQIGHASEIKNSIIMNNSKVAHLNYVGDSIIGSNVNISGGAILANFRFDGLRVTIKFKDQRIDTGLLKFGSIVSDSVIVGVNSVLNPGTILAKGCVVYPLVSASGYYEKNSHIK